ncbi:peptidoglycan-binding protein [Kitasatospora sp. NPDC048194]|uniref:peptidoglycan-binding domain-containing protein n=1 Tax=Kitasatospora sp. NPDC048194 TaxID=3364045 RepID=UPI0037248BC4
MRLTTVRLLPVLAGVTAILTCAAPAHADPNTTYLSYGDRGVGVKCVQIAVGVTADSVWGPDTDRAVRAFQRSHFGHADGIVGPQTGDALMNRLNAYYGWCYSVIPTSY